MRNSKKVIAIALIVMLSTSFIANASEANKSGRRVKLLNEGKKVELLYFANTATKVSITVEDESREIIYKGITSAKSGFRLPFDMTSLPAGEYTFTIKDGADIHVKTVRTSETMTNAKMINVIKRDDIKGFAVVSQHEVPVDLDLYIYDNDGTYIYKELISSDQQIKAKYDLEHFSDQTVEVVIKEGEYVLKSESFKFD